MYPERVVRVFFLKYFLQSITLYRKVIEVLDGRFGGGFGGREGETAGECAWDGGAGCDADAGSFVSGGVADCFALAAV